MTLPLVIGVGVTNGIHILNRVAEEQIGILPKVQQGGSRVGLTPSPVRSLMLAKIKACKVWVL